MSSTVKAQIKLRTDTISNWLANGNSIIHDKELIIVKFDDGTIGIKFGSGLSYTQTPFVKFGSLIGGNLTDGTNTFTFPNSTGTLALTSDLDSKADQTDVNTINAIIATLITEDQTQNSVIATLVTENTSQNNSISNLQSNITTLNSSVSTINSNISTINSNIQTIQSNLDYKFYNVPNVSNTYTLKNKRVNYIQLSTSENATIILPPVENEFVRDFILRLEIVMSGDIPQITFEASNNEDIDFEEITENWSNIQKGTNILTFTESYRSSTQNS